MRVERQLPWLLLLAIFASRPLFAQFPPHPDHRFFKLGDLRLESGKVLPDARLLYVTYGRLNTARDNAVVTLSYHGGNHHGYDFLLAPGGGLDTTKYFVIATEMFGAGGSSSPSNTPAPYNGPRFPQTTIRDNVGAIHRLVTEGLGLPHVRAIAGFSMGAMQALQWAVSHSDFMDAVVAWCGTAKTYPRTWLMVETGIRVWQADAAFAGGNYTSRPWKGQAASAAHWASWLYSDEWWQREMFKPKWPSPQALLDDWSTDSTAPDPNNEILQSRTWQQHDVSGTMGFDGDLGRALGSITAPVLLMPSTTDRFFPMEDMFRESRMIHHVKVAPIQTLAGHAAGAGCEGCRVDEGQFLSREIGQFLAAARPRSR
jgi:homoserine O-acetyltransferase